MIYFESGITGNAPRIGWNNAMRRGTVTASSEATGFDVGNIASPFEYSYWQATATTFEWVRLELSVSETINAVCIQEHNLGSTGQTIRFNVPDGLGGWTPVGPVVSPTTDDPIVILLADRDLDDMRLAIYGGSSAPRVAVLYFCEVLSLPQNVYAGVGTPINMARRTKYQNTQTVSGKWAGRTIQRERNYNDFPVRHLRESWVQANLDPFIEDARSYPYFLCERPADYPSAVSYRWREDDILPTRMGVSGDMMEVTL